MHVLILSHDLGENAVGRAYVLWLLARELGSSVVVAGPQRGDFWGPLRSSEFAEDCVPLGRWPCHDPRLRDLASNADAIVAVKTWPASFGCGITVAKEAGVPLILDVDEDDFGALLGQDASRPRAARSTIRMASRGTNAVRFRRLQSVAQSWPHVLVSSPVLSSRFPTGKVIPHARPIRPTPRRHTSSNVRIGFVGTVRKHKGLELLRDAVREFGDEVTLTITADPPAHPHPGEEWVGGTSIAAGRELLETCDLLVAPTSPTGYGATQLPAKVVDAMSLGLVPVATGTPALRWALDEGDAGILVGSRTASSLVDALSMLMEPEYRQAVAIRAHERARDVFSVECVAQDFRSALVQAGL